MSAEATQFSFYISVKHLSQVILDGQKVSDTTGQIKIAGDDAVHVIKAEDQAGNSTEVTITVYREHVFSDYKETGRNGKTITEQAACGHCGKILERTKQITAEGTTDITKEEYQMDGSLAVAVEVKPDTPKTEVEGLNIEIAKNILEKQGISVALDKNYKVYLEMEKKEKDDFPTDDVTSTMEEAEKIHNLQNGMFVDISMWSQIGTNQAKKLNNVELQKQLTISMNLEGTGLLVPAGKVRTYYIIRVHNGETDVLQGSENVWMTGKVLNFKTERFSTYSIWYTETNAPTPSGGGTIGGGGTTGGGSTGGGTTKPGKPGKPGSGKTSGGTTSGKDEGSGGDSTGDNSTVGTTGADTTPEGKSDGIQAGGDGQKPGNGQNSGETPQTSQTVEPQPADKFSKEDKKQFRDALEVVRNILPEIGAGPYIQIPESSGEDDENQMSGDANAAGQVQITLQIPDDLKAEGRNFYLIGVDAEGNIIILPNESPEDGMLTVTGTPGTTYQIIYEDGSTLLSGLLTEDGKLMDADGNRIQVNTNHCFWHWIILMLALAGTLLIPLRRKYPRQQLLILGIAVVLMLLCILFGWCRWDVIFTIVGAVVMTALTMPGFFRSRQRGNRNA